MVFGTELSFGGHNQMVRVELFQKGLVTSELYTYSLHHEQGAQ